ncbi:MAG: sodium:alanine symporter family protein, partial [Flavobacteriaceae bacterium]|nr:sodium:alanine symporter family protein [Flavobacteriaceae bacterium]
MMVSAFAVQLSENTLGFDDRLNEAFMPFAIWWENLVFTELRFFGIGIPIVLILLLSGALFFTVYFRFVNIRRFPTALRVVRGDYDHLEIEANGPDAHGGEVNHFQALATAVSGTVGLGNIAMVAVAISIGGPGATFWMIIAGLLGMSTKFVECTLGVKYRDIDDQGRVFGGPMYY